MRTTPNCNYARATTAEDIIARKSKTNYVVEYIAVKDTQDARNRYRDNMRINIGPAESWRPTYPFRYSWSACRAPINGTARVNQDERTP